MTGVRCSTGAAGEVELGGESGEEDDRGDDSGPVGGLTCDIFPMKTKKNNKNFEEEEEKLSATKKQS